MIPPKPSSSPHLLAFLPHYISYFVSFSVNFSLYLPPSLSSSLYPSIIPSLPSIFFFSLTSCHSPLYVLFLSLTSCLCPFISANLFSFTPERHWTAEWKGLWQQSTRNARALQGNFSPDIISVAAMRPILDQTD